MDRTAHTLIKQIESDDPTLLTADLMGHELDDSDLKALAAVLPKNHHLKRLNLSNNDIGLSGAEFLAKAIEDNQSLETLDLSQNHIPRDGIAALIDALHYNTSLRHLELFGNNIGPELTEKVEAILEPRRPEDKP